MENTVVGLFESAERAHDAFGALIEEGFDQDHVSLLVNETAAEYFRSMEGTNDKELDDATAGAEKGALIGGGAGLLLGLGAIFIPGVGAALALGPLAAALTGVGVGAATGSLIGGFTKTGLSEEHAHAYAEGLRRGGTIVAVSAPPSDIDDAVAIMRENGAVDIEERARQWRDGGWPGTMTPL
jgi:hypothetical protein